MVNSITWQSSQGHDNDYINHKQSELGHDQVYGGCHGYSHDNVHDGANSRDTYLTLNNSGISSRN